MSRARRHALGVAATVLACAAPPAPVDAVCPIGMQRLWTLELQPELPAALHRLGAERTWGLANLSVEGSDGDRVLVVRYPAGSINPENRATPQGGAGFLYPGPEAGPRARACLSYEVRFPEGFDFVRGGKLPGLYGGGAPSGGAAVTNDSGFSVRLMWRAGGAGEAYAYTIDKRNARYGDSIGRGSWRFRPGRWQRIDLEAVVNAPGRADGALRVWVDDKLVIERLDTTYRTHSAAGVDGLMFSTFFGGHDASWATPREQRVEFRRLEFWSPAP